MRFKQFALLALLASLAWAKPAQADTYKTCAGFITSLPAVISTQGTWCLRQDLSTAMTGGEAITIAANNVTIDCNNFKIGGLAGGPDTAAIGILATDRLNATVRNCNVRGFQRGLLFTGLGGAGHLVQDNRFDGNRSYGIIVVGDGSVVERNAVLDTTGTTLDFPGDSFGIFTVGSVDILNNLVSGISVVPNSAGWATGIYAYDQSNGSISNNRIRNLVADVDGFTFGIQSNASGHLVISGNEITGDFLTSGEAQGYLGIGCATNSSRTAGNSISGVEIPVTTKCTGYADNYVTP